MSHIQVKNAKHENRNKHESSKFEMFQISDFKFVSNFGIRISNLHPEVDNA